MLPGRSAIKEAATPALKNSMPTGPFVRRESPNKTPQSTSNETGRRPWLKPHMLSIRTGALVAVGANNNPAPGPGSLSESKERFGTRSLLAEDASSPSHLTKQSTASVENSAAGKSSMARRPSTATPIVANANNPASSPSLRKSCRENRHAQVARPAPESTPQMRAESRFVPKIL